MRTRDEVIRGLQHALNRLQSWKDTHEFMMRASHVDKEDFHKNQMENYQFIIDKIDDALVELQSR